MQRANKDGADILATRPNGQTGAPVFASRLAQRKSFHPRQESKENGLQEVVANGPSGRPTSSGSSSDHRIEATHATRIPRPSPSQRDYSHPRKPLSFSEAYRMAEEEEAARGSPSPAPRTWRNRGDSNESRMQKMLNHGPLNLGGRRNSGRSAGSGRDDDTQSSTGSTASMSHRSEGSESDIDRKLVQYEEDQVRMEGVMGGKNGIFTKSRVGPKVAETGQELHRKSSNNSLDGGSPSKGARSWGIRGKSNPNWLKRMVSSPGKTDAAQSSVDWEQAGQDVPIPSVEGGGGSADNSPQRLWPATVTPPSRSPNKSFAWQADADFTAGDLQISESPPVKVGNSTNAHETIRSRPRNNKLDEIKQLEIEAALKFPDEPARQESEEPDDVSSRKSENERGNSKNRHLGRTNTKIDEIRAREIESLSKKALATARLDEIRERNAEYRSPSPEIGRKASRELLRESTPGFDDLNAPLHGRTILEEEGEHIPNTPITIFRNPSSDKPSSGTIPENADKPDAGRPSNSARNRSQSREDSREVLRKLARVTSLSPSLEEQEARSAGAPTSEDKGLGSESDRRSDGDSGLTGAEKSVEPPKIRIAEEVKPFVGFAFPGLRRVSSTESASTKRSSMAQSDADPIDRIEGEMKLFAPLDNQSERGSIRAPSPDSDEEEDDDDERGVEETPRPPKPDPLSQPTPKVTGAYVETPATVKVEKTEEFGPELLKPEPQKPLSSIAVSSFLRGRPSRIGKSDDTKSDSGRKETARSTSLSSLRRSRSVPRNRSPLFNSARPPSVRDDLLEIQRMHQVEDSTLDDFDGLLASHNVKPSEVEKILKSEPPELEEEIIPKEILDRERELEAYDRMSKSLKTGLLGIQTAKKGIERLEDKVSHSDSARQLHETHNVHHASCPLCAAHSPANMVTYIHIPVPRLYYRQPKFRLSMLGLLLLLLAIWFTAENTMCSYYCKPEYCEEGKDCTWSPDDPDFGFAIPIKLDQWTTGGQGRSLAHQLGEEMEDLLADAWDFVTSTDITKVDTRYLNFDQKRQHRRRLKKKGLVKPWTDPPDQKAKLDAWRSARQARERAREAREMGYDIGDGFGDDSMAGDERISRW